MLKKFNKYFIVFVCVCLYSSLGAKPNQEEMIKTFIEESSNMYSQYEVLLIIKKKYPIIWSSIPIGNPVRKKTIISSKYGYRINPITKLRKLHTGIDLASDFANRVYSTANGTVIYSDKKGGYGNCIIVDHKNGYKTLYGHLSYNYKKVGDEVDRNSIIGFIGNTGASTGDHLHYEIRKNDVPINPFLSLSYK